MAYTPAMQFSQPYRQLVVKPMQKTVNQSDIKKQKVL